MSANDGVRVPGRLLLRVASFCFDEPALTKIIQPAIADFQREVLEAGARGFAVRFRGYVALVKVLSLALLMPGVGAGAPLTSLLLGRGGGSLALLAVLLFAAMWPIFGVFVVGAILAGLALAVGLRVWNSQHPAAVACTRRIYGKDPEINISSVPVGGNIGGFFFVLSSSLTILLGLPELRGFVLGAMVGGALLAWGLFAWRRSHDGSSVTAVVLH
jgi:hypothetical protein